jgi:hypothetical protein
MAYTLHHADAEVMVNGTDGDKNRIIERRRVKFLRTHIVSARGWYLRSGEQYRSYVVTYQVGLDLVRDYIERITV